MEEVVKCDLNRIICPHCGHSLFYQAYFHTTSTGDGYTFPCKKCGEYMHVKVRKTQFWFETKKHPNPVWEKTNG